MIKKFNEIIDKTNVKDNDKNELYKLFIKSINDKNYIDEFNLKIYKLPIPKSQIDYLNKNLNILLEDNINKYHKHNEQQSIKNIIYLYITYPLCFFITINWIFYLIYKSSSFNLENSDIYIFLNKNIYNRLSNITDITKPLELILYLITLPLIKIIKTNIPLTSIFLLFIVIFIINSEYINFFIKNTTSIIKFEKSNLYYFSLSIILVYYFLGSYIKSNNENLNNVSNMTKQEIISIIFKIASYFIPWFIKLIILIISILFIVFISSYISVYVIIICLILISFFGINITYSNWIKGYNYINKLSKNNYFIKEEDELFEKTYDKIYRLITKFIHTNIFTLPYILLSIYCLYKTLIINIKDSYIILFLSLIQILTIIIFSVKLFVNTTNVLTKEKDEFNINIV